MRGVIGECGFKANGALSRVLRWKTLGGLRGRGGNQYKRRERLECKGPLALFPGLDAHFLIFFFSDA